MNPRILVFVISIAVSLSSTIHAEDDYLKLKMKNRGQALEAKVVRYDFNSLSFDLVDRSGTELTIEISEFADSDKRILVRALEKQLFSKAASKKAAEKKSDKEASTNDSLENQDVNPGRNKSKTASPKALTASGVRWHEKFDDAASEATEKSPTGGERPVLWFRVLGDLKGFM